MLGPLQKLLATYTVLFPGAWLANETPQPPPPAGTSGEASKPLIQKKKLFTDAQRLIYLKIPILVEAKIAEGKLTPAAGKLILENYERCPSIEHLQQNLALRPPPVLTYYKSFYLWVLLGGVYAYSFVNKLEKKQAAELDKSSSLLMALWLTYGVTFLGISGGNYTPPPYLTVGFLRELGIHHMYLLQSDKLVQRLVYAEIRHWIDADYKNGTIPESLYKTGVSELNQSTSLETLLRRYQHIQNALLDALKKHTASNKDVHAFRDIEDWFAYLHAKGVYAYC